jgi:hypothetical protein
VIVLAAGMPRAGSGWHYNLTHDLMVTAGAADAREIRRRYHLGRILTQVNCNIGALTINRLGPVMAPSLLGNTFTIKVHSGPTPAARYLIDRGKIKPTYIYRDPRDALLSAYEYGQRAIERGHPNAFSHLDTMEKAIAFMAEQLEYWEEWTGMPACLSLRYEDLKTDYDHQAVNLAEFLGIDHQQPKAAAVIEQYRPEKASAGDSGLHFVKGVSGRYREKLTPAERKLCLDMFGEKLSQMGYLE